MSELKDKNEKDDAESLALFKVYTMEGTIFYLSSYDPYTSSGITYKSNSKVTFNSDMIIAVVERRSRNEL